MQEEIVEMSCDRVRLRIWNRKSRETGTTIIWFSHAKMPTDLHSLRKDKKLEQISKKQPLITT